jgi:endonuclease/exonuclease/phosphatase family metal-dependent hydrolase
VRTSCLLLLATGLLGACTSNGETANSTGGAGVPSGASSSAGGAGNAGSSAGGNAGSSVEGGVAGEQQTGGLASTAGRAGEAGAAGASAALQLNITTSNIRFDSPDDGVNVWPERKALLFHVLKAQAFDSAGLQEALAGQLADFAQAMPEYGQVGVGRNDGKTKGEYSAILYSREHYEVISSGTFWFSETPEVPGSKTWGNTLPRICTWARLRHLDSGRTYYHYNVHLDSESQPSREKSAQLLAARIAARAEQGDPVILTGDFNAEPDNVAVRYLLGSQDIDATPTPFKVEDAWLRLHPDNPLATTSHKFKGGTTGGDHIDYVMFGAGVTAASVSIDTTHADAVYPSDHYPVSAVLELAP